MTKTNAANNVRLESEPRTPVCERRRAVGSLKAKSHVTILAMALNVMKKPRKLYSFYIHGLNPLARAHSELINSESYRQSVGLHGRGSARRKAATYTG
jgi:hypothetical protein